MRLALQEFFQLTRRGELFPALGAEAESPLDSNRPAMTLTGPMPPQICLVTALVPAYATPEGSPLRGGRLVVPQHLHDSPLTRLLPDSPPSLLATRSFTLDLFLADSISAPRRRVSGRGVIRSSITWVSEASISACTSGFRLLK